jgi:rRNA-processing protein FCF1
MTKILPDTNVLLSNPEILSRSAPGVEFLVLSEVLDELRAAGAHYKGTQDVARVVYDAIERGNAKLLDASSLLSPGEYAQSRSSADLLLLKSLAAFDERHESAFVASNDGQLRHVARDVGLDVRGSQETLAFLAEQNATTVPELRASADATKRRSLQYTVRSFLAAVAGSALANLAIEQLDVIVRTINIWGTTIALPLLGVGFYLIRAKYRLTYGFIEFIVGLISALRVFLPDFRYAALDELSILQIVGGLYIMVRGMDNIGKGLGGTRWQPLWQHVFRE